MEELKRALAMLDKGLDANQVRFIEILNRCDALQSFLHRNHKLIMRLMRENPAEAERLQELLTYPEIPPAWEQYRKGLLNNFKLKDYHTLQIVCEKSEIFMERMRRNEDFLPYLFFVNQKLSQTIETCRQHFIHLNS